MVSIRRTSSIAGVVLCLLAVTSEKIMLLELESMKTSRFVSRASSRYFFYVVPANFLVLLIRSLSRSCLIIMKNVMSHVYPHIIFVLWLSVMERTMKSGIFNRSQFRMMEISIWVKRYNDKRYNQSVINKLYKDNYQMYIKTMTSKINSLVNWSSSTASRGI